MKKIFGKTKTLIKAAVVMLCVLLPWAIRRKILEIFMGYRIHPSCKIGFSWVFTQKMNMEPHAKISHFTVIKGLEELNLGPYAFIGKGNWITGFAADRNKHYEKQCGRRSQLILGEHSAITNAHIIDCTDSVTIGRFTTMAGYASQILTHSIDLDRCRQWSEPVVIGDYCFLGTNAVILAGSSLPDFSVLGAKSLLNKSYLKQYHLFAGVPARPARRLPQTLGYFNRKVGFVS